MTQGTIFTCGVAEDYPECTVHGLVITARCDAANDKVPTYDYLPVVTLDDWLHRDGRITIAQRFMKETVGKIKTALTEAGFSSSILDTETVGSLLNTLFAPAPSGQANKARDRFQDLCSRHNIATLGLSSAPPAGICPQIAKMAPKLRDSVVGELVRQQLAGYYFLSQVEPDGDDTGNVVLLREIQTLPRGVAHAVSQGLDANRFAEMCNTEPELRGHLRIGSADLAMPLGIVRSPNIEHLMQSFSLLFGRIGISDPDPRYIAGLWGRQPSTSEAH